MSLSEDDKAKILEKVAFTVIAVVLLAAGVFAFKHAAAQSTEPKKIFIRYDGKVFPVE